MKLTKYKILSALVLGISTIVLAACSGESSKTATDTATTVASPAAQNQPARFHHVRLNVTAPKASIDYYKKFFSAVPIEFRGVTDAILTDRSYFLFNTVEKTPPSNAKTALWHVGWGGIDGPSEHKWRTAQGMKWNTEITKVGVPGGGHVHFMYAAGPDGVLVEIVQADPLPDASWLRHIHSKDK